MSFTPKGIVVPIVTPVDENGKLNEKAYRDLIEYLYQGGIHGVFPFGTTGEFYAYDLGFYTHLLEVTKDAVAGRMQIYAGANHITTKGAAEIAKAVEKVGGIDALSVLTPMFVSQTQEEVYTYYKEVAAATSLPIIIYNNKPKTNVGVDPATVAKLAEIDNIVAAKDSTGDMTNAEEYIRLTRGMEFSVMMGRDTLILAGLHYGATGAIASCANVAPRIAVDIYDKFNAGDYQGALDAQFKLSALRVATNMGSFPVTLKEALKLIGHDCGDCVKPILPLHDDQREKLRKVLSEMGLL
ncbi:MAG: dihydrodipicolinate synthase family protein [Clostridia bacterium]|nr:dihydrodipicolinate synthase family protein [Clostridia bacterium]MBQ6233326.1 dihydrodipicolinate synthase family protein [Clostridia bacterium]